MSQQESLESFATRVLIRELRYAATFEQIEEISAALNNVRRLMEAYRQRQVQPFGMSVIQHGTTSQPQQRVMPQRPARDPLARGPQSEPQRPDLLPGEESSMESFDGNLPFEMEDWE